MIGFGDRVYATIWEIEDKDTYALVKFGTSRKDKRDDSYKNSSWSYTRWVGDAYRKISELGLEEKSRVIVKGGISWEPYVDSTGERRWSKTPQITIFNVELAEAYDGGGGGRMDTPPQVQDDGDDEIPF
ncbi:MAG TPA: hypothetical protein VMX17_09520 [Candidatus Glassbacteria bacterium]|nr:hypothetical protein [Candidatus Glassbacteria bacterium]